MKGSIVWSQHRLDVAACGRKYYYQYKKRPRPKVKQPADMAFGSFLHRALEGFYNKNGLPRYKSAATFVSALQGRWLRFPVRTGKYGGREINWTSSSEPYYYKNEIKKIGEIIYNNYSVQEPPLYAELKFAIRVNGRFFRGRFDEIRRGLIIRDHKYRKKETSIPREMESKYDSQFTLYTLGFVALLKDDLEFRRNSGVSEKEIKAFLKDPDSLFNRIRLQYHMLQTGQIVETKRSMAEISDLLNIVPNLEDRINRNDYTPNRGRHCDYCLYKKICDEDTQRENKDLDLQLKLIPTPKEPVKLEQITLHFPIKKVVGEL